MEAPFLSIVIPSYNRAEFLRKSVASALASASGEIEILVSNNASEDHSDAVMQGFQDSRLRYFRQPQNVGFARNFQFLVREARGEYVFFLTDDDYFLSGGVEMVLDFIKRFRPDGFKCGLMVHQIQSQAAYLYSAFKKSFIADPEDFESQAGIFWNSHIASCTGFRRAVVDMQVYETHIGNLYPSMMYMAFAQARLGYLHEPVVVHIWENEVFWDGGVKPEDTARLLQHRAAILDIFEHRVPKGFLKACESKINQFSLNVPSITRFLTEEEKRERRVAFKRHAVEARYDSFLKRWVQPLDRWIRREVSEWLARQLVR